MDAPKPYTHPKIEILKTLREDRNRNINQNVFLRIPTEDNRWTDSEILAHKNRLALRPICKFGNNCDRLQCVYSHENRAEICKDFRWCDDPKCKKIHPTQKFCDYLDYTDKEILLEQGFIW
tara:strand:- start:509 stop:871 length:363 start_codon:yes stop_codon:yes gene_type:complete